MSFLIKKNSFHQKNAQIPGQIHLLPKFLAQNTPENAIKVHSIVHKTPVLSKKSEITPLAACTLMKLAQSSAYSRFFSRHFQLNFSQKHQMKVFGLFFGTSKITRQRKQFAPWKKPQNTIHFFSKIKSTQTL